MIKRVSSILVGLCLGATAAYGAEELTRGLVLHLPLDGDCKAMAGVGAAAAANNPPFVEGKFGQALKLEDAAYLTTPLPDCLRRCEFTIAFWIKPLWNPRDELPHPILSIPTDPKKRDTVGWSADQFRISKGWSEVISPNGLYGVVNHQIAMRQLKRDTWAHVVIAYSATNQLRADYFNGQGHRFPWKPAPFDCTGGQIWWGSRDDKRGGGDFVVDDIRVYDRMVDEKELPAIAGVAFPPPEQEDVFALQACDPSRAPETPHVAWAKPYAGGKISVLCVAEQEKTREFIELTQRADIEVTVIGMPTLDQLTMANKNQVQERGRRIEDALVKDQYQAIVIAAFPWDLLAEATRAAVMNFVNNGGGLLLVTPWCALDGASTSMAHGFAVGWAGATEGRKLEALVSPVEGEDAHWLVDGIPWHSLSMFGPQLNGMSPNSLFRGGKVGKGRLLIYDLYQRTSASTYQCLTPEIAYSRQGSAKDGYAALLFDEFEYDYMLGAAAKAVLWAAGKTAPTRIQQVSFRLAPPSVTPALGLKGQWSLEVLNTSGKETKAEVRLTLRGKGPDASTVQQQSAVLKPGRNTLSFGSVIGHIGAIFGDAQILTDGKVMDWASGTIEAMPGVPYLGEVRADRELYQADQPPRITASFAHVKYAFRPGETGELGWRLYDGSDRLIERGQKTVLFDPQDGVLAADTFALSPLPEGCLGYTLVVDLGRNGIVTDQRQLFLRRYRDPTDDFRFTLWGGYGDPVGSLATRILKERYQADCVSVYLNIGRPDLSALAECLDWHNRHDLYSWIYATSIMNGAHIADVGQARRLDDHMAAVGAVGASRNVLFYSLGDETGMGNPARPPSGYEQEDFRVQMQAQYKTLDALNKTWNTRFTDWSDVIIPIPPPADTNISLVPMTAAGAYREGLFARCAAIGTDGARRPDPKARVGIEGMSGLMQAWPSGDLWSLSQATTFLGPYSLGMEQDMIRSFQKPGDLLGGWFNYESLCRDYSLSGPWIFLLSGADTFMWFQLMGDSQYSALNPDFSPFQQFTWTYEELAPILSGVGKLCKTADREHPGVAILHNQRNLNRSIPALWSTMQAYSLLKHVGVWPDFIHGEQIKAGELAQRNVRVLWLAHQFTMEEEVASEMRKFVEAGGAVIADTEPGIGNGYGRYEKPLLADLFADPSSIKSAMPPSSSEEAARWKDRVKTVGKGRTLFFAVGSGEWLTYRRDWFRPRGAGLRQAVTEFLSNNGVKAPIRAQTADGDWEPLDVVTYRLGGSRYAAFQRRVSAILPHPEPRAFEIVNAAGKAYHIYDARAGEYLGESDRARLTVECARGGMVAFLPYRAESIEVGGLPETCAPGTTLRIHLALTAKGPTPDGGVFRTECLDPSGRRVAPLSGKFSWGAGGVTVPLVVAYNDPVGRWKLVVTDIATGTRLEKPFEVVMQQGRNSR